MSYTREELQKKDIPEVVAALRQFIIGAAQKQNIDTTEKSVHQILTTIPRLREVTLHKIVKIYQSFAVIKIDPTDRAFFFSQINHRLGLINLPTIHDGSGTRNITNAQPDEALRLIADTLYDRYQAKDRKSLPSYLKFYMQIFLNFNKHLPDQMISVESHEYKDFLKEQYYVYFPLIRERLNQRVRDEVSEVVAPAIMAELDAILQVLSPEVKFSVHENKIMKPMEGLVKDPQVKVAHHGDKGYKQEEEARVAQRVADIRKEFQDFMHKHSDQPLTKVIMTYMFFLMKKESKVDAQERQAFKKVLDELMQLYAAEFPSDQKDQAVRKLNERLKRSLKAFTDHSNGFKPKS